MRDILYDIVRNTSCIGPGTTLKIDGNDEEINIKGKRDDNTMILEAKTNKVVDDFKGIFGIGNLPMLSGLLNFPSFKDKNAKIKIVREVKNKVEIPTEIVFEAVGSASANFRLVGEAAIPRQLVHKEIEWDIVIENPSKMKISEFEQLASIYAGQETSFTAKTVKNELKFFVGNEDASSHKASFTFAENIKGTLKSGFTWNIKDLLNVLKLSDGATSVLRLSNQGVLQIDIDTGICKYEFILPGSN